MALLALVYGTGEQWVLRRRASSLLWPEASESRARHSLSQALYVLKQEYPDLLVGETHGVGAGEAECDVAGFRRAVANLDWRAASQLYGSPFAQGLSLPNSPALSHWVEGVRETLTLSAERVVRELMESFEWAPVEQLTMVLVEQGRLKSEVVTARIEALHQLGDRARAAEFVSGLSGEIRAVAEAALAAIDGRAANVRSNDAQLFVGRVDELARLTELFRDTISGKPSIALISGEPGTGKTALANRFHRLLVLKGAKVLLASGHPAEQNTPLGILAQWLQDLSARDVELVGNPAWMEVIRHVFPEFGGRHQPNDRFPFSEVGVIGHQRLLESLRRLFIELARHKPLVLGLDDLQHADQASLSFVHFLFRHNLSEPVLFVATMRVEQVADQSPLQSWDFVTRVHLGGLEANEVEIWLARLDREFNDLPRTASFLCRRTAGNPLLISALLEERTDLQSDELPPQSVVDFYRDRILSRSKAAQRLLAAMSLVGEPNAWPELVKICGLSPREGEEACRELEDYGWIIFDGDDLVLRHGLLGQSAMSLLSAIERKALHARAVRIMGAQGKLPHTMAAISHDLVGNQADAFSAAVQAAEACKTLHARKEREFFLKIALSNSPDSEQAALTRIKLARHLLEERRSHEALDMVDPIFFQDRVDALALQAELVRIQVEAEQASHLEDLDLLRIRAEHIKQDLGPLLLADTYSHLAGIAHDFGFDQKSLEIAEDIFNDISGYPLTIESAQKLLRPLMVIAFNRGFQNGLAKISELPEPTEGDPSYACAFHARRGSILIAAGNLLRGEADLGEALALAERYALFDQHFLVHNNLGVCFLEQGKYAAAEEHFRAAEQYVDPDMSPGRHAIVLDNFAILEFERGNRDQAYELATRSTSDRTRTGARGIVSIQCIIGLCALERGALVRSVEAEREIRLILDNHAPTGNDMSHVHVFLAKMLEVRGAVQTAITQLADAANWYQSRHVPAFCRIQLERLRLLLRSGVDCSDEIDALLSDLQGTGAIPLIERAESLKTRAGLHDA